MPDSHCHEEGHDHDHADSDEMGIQYNLFEKIDKENLQCLNETIDGSGKSVFKSWDKRMDRDNDSDSSIANGENTSSTSDLETLQYLNNKLPRILYLSSYHDTPKTQFVESDADEELLFNIPFTGNVKLKGIRISSEDTDSHPAKLRLYKNRPNMTFDDVSIEPDQVFELQKDCEGVLEYSPKVVSFSSVSHLSMHFPSNFGADCTRIYYIGLKGEWTPGHTHGVTICTYEARPNLDDHKLKHLDSVAKHID